MGFHLEESGYDVWRPSPVLVGNQSADPSGKGPEHQSTMKHVHRAYHWIRDHVERKDIAVSHVPGHENPADIFEEVKPADVSTPCSRGVYYGSIIYLSLSIVPIISGVYCDVWVYLVHCLSTAHTSLHRSLVIGRPK